MSEAIHPLTTPNGNRVQFILRNGMDDINTVYSVAAIDEYRLHKDFTGPLSGWALDIGGHVGGVALCLALDHPGLKVIVIEPVLENVELIERAAELNRINTPEQERLTVIHGAVGPGPEVRVRYGWKNDEDDYEQHAWVGNSDFVYPVDPPGNYETITVPSVDLLELEREMGGPPCLVKVDCEGGEWPVLRDLVALHSPRVVGEWHPVMGHTKSDELRDAFLAAGYQTNFTGPITGPGGFEMIKVR